MNVNSQEIRPVLQYRWRLVDTGEGGKLLYYGLRNYPVHQQKIIPVNKDMAGIVHAFDGTKPLVKIFKELVDDEIISACRKDVYELIEKRIIVDKEDVRKPATLDNHQTCIKCVNNDYVLPGLEFDEEGVCAFCQCYKNVEDTGPVHGGIITEEELHQALKGNQSRFDVMVLYTGGKDSSFLLWYLAKKMGLRVLACTWDLPFTNNSSRRNMRAARARLPNVEFIEHTVCWDKIKDVLRVLFDRVGLPCICPVIAAVLFYPVAVREKIPFVMDGVEAAQTIILSRIMGPPARVDAPSLTDYELTLRHVRRFIAPDIESNDPWDSFLGLVKNLLGSIYDPLVEVLKDPAPAGLPLMKRLKSETVYGTWRAVREIIERELNWQMPEGQEGLLHTSCDIETVKDFSQFKRFAGMRTMSMPQSIIEISAAIHFGLISRDEGFKELSERGYYGEPATLQPLLDKLDLNEDDIRTMTGELPYILNGCCL